jgi:hypothetical protein
MIASRPTMHEHAFVQVRGPPRVLLSVGQQGLEPWTDGL